MLNMKEKVFVMIVVVFIAVVAAAVFVPVRTIDVKLVTSPAGDGTYVPAGEPFNITCKGLADTGSKFSSMKWMDKEGNVISEGIPGVQNEGSNAVTLIFTNPKTDESGVYKCSAMYDTIHALEKSFKIVFYSPKPTFESTYENITSKEGSKLEVICSAVGDKPITYEWYQYDDKVSEDSNSTIFVQNTESQSTLTIQKVAKSHEGVFTCLAKNEHGLTSKVYELTVLSSGDETDDGKLSNLKVEVRNITSNSVKFFIALTGSVNSIEVKYQESRDVTEYRVKWEHGDNYEVKGLIPSGRYTFQFRIASSENGDWSKAYAVVLLPDTPELIFQNVQDGNVKLQWFVKIDDVMRSTIDSYELRYFSVQMEGGNKWNPSTCATIIQIPSCVGPRYTIAGLSRNVYYEIQLRAHTVSGYGEPYKQKIILPA